MNPNPVQNQSLSSPPIYLSSYKPPLLLSNGHLQTVYPAIFRSPTLPKPYVRERISTPDDDFLDLDWLKSGNKKLVIISHGLEGDSQRPYVKGLARAAYNAKIDVLAWNYRGCSGEINLQPRMYHSGATDDLRLVIAHASKNYQEIYLSGFSLGGNLTLKYLGEQKPPGEIKKACVFSVPLDLKSGAVNLERRKNYLYEKRFMKSLLRKAKAKHEQYPELFDIAQLERLKTVYDFDDNLTAPVHGFENANDYYNRCSSKNFIEGIVTPTWIISAANDPFLTPEILKQNLADSSPYVHYLITQDGGHCGYPIIGKEEYWSEAQAIHFFSES